MPASAEKLEGSARDLTIVRTFDAPRELVFSLWTTPEHTIRWMGPRDYPATHFEQDVRVGGKWRGCLTGGPESHAPGSELWQGGEYRDIVPPERLVFTFAWDDGPETVVTIILTETDDGGTRMVFHQTPFDTAGNRDGHGEGWNSSFDRLVDLITLPVIRTQFGGDAVGRASGTAADQQAAQQRQSKPDAP